MNVINININTQETEIPSRIGNHDNVTWDNSKEFLKLLGWRIRTEQPPRADGYERVSATPVEGDGGLLSWGGAGNRTLYFIKEVL